MYVTAKLFCIFIKHLNPDFMDFGPLIKGKRADLSDFLKKANLDLR